jgi:hypothetical protein
MVPREPREKWTDERLDDGFARLDGNIRELRGEVKDLRAEMNSRFDKMNARFDTIHSRFDAQNRTLMGVGAAIVAALIGVNAF